MLFAMTARKAAMCCVSWQKSAAGDKGFDTEDCVAGLRQLGVTPHVAQNDTNRNRSLDGRTARHPGYTVSLNIRKLIEARFG